MPDIDIKPPDMGGIGNVASGSKAATGGTTELKDFSVKRGDNGGVIVCETYRKKPPAGRRAGPSFMDGHDYKENPFSPDDGAAVHEHVKGLMGQMGISVAEPAPPPEAVDVAAVRGPRGTAARVSPGGGMGDDDGDEAY